MNENPRGRPAIPPGARIALVVNPAARQGHDRDTIASAARALGERFMVDVVAPPGADAVEQSVRESAASHHAIVVAGGDGTINRAANGLCGSTRPLGIIPMGTGNDFARGCGIPSSATEAVGRILDGRTGTIDLVRVNDRVFCTVGLIGVAADIALTVTRLTAPGARARGLVRLLGDGAYRVSALGHLLKPAALTEHISIVGESGEILGPPEPVHALFVTNTRVLGGGLVLPVDADPSDGVAEIAVVPRMTRLRLLWAFACFAQGRPVPPGTLRVWRAAGATISCARALRFSADGDLMCESDRFEVEVLPGALTLIV
jgi:diacylglycerol kinase (ATP)